MIEEKGRAEGEGRKFSSMAMLKRARYKPGVNTSTFINKESGSEY